MLQAEQTRHWGGIPGVVLLWEVPTGDCGQGKGGTNPPNGLFWETEVILGKQDGNTVALGKELQRNSLAATALSFSSRFVICYNSRERSTCQSNTGSDTLHLGSSFSLASLLLFSLCCQRFRGKIVSLSLNHSCICFEKNSCFLKSVTFPPLGTHLTFLCNLLFGMRSLVVLLVVKQLWEINPSPC